MLSCGSWSEPQQWGSKVEVSWGDSSQIRKGSVFGVLETPKRFSSQGPVVKTAVRGCLKTSGGGPEERKHIFG